MATSLTYLLLTLGMLVSAASCASVDKAPKSSARSTEISPIVAASTATATSVTKKQLPKPVAKVEPSKQQVSPCCCCQNASPKYPYPSMADPRLERVVREIVQFAILKLQAMRSQPAWSNDFSMMPMPPMMPMYSMMPMQSTFQGYPTRAVPASPPVAAVAPQASSSSGKPLGFDISNGMLEAGVGTDGVKFGLNDAAMKNLFEAANSVTGNAGLSMGFGL